jgi:hypothetical protein
VRTRSWGLCGPNDTWRDIPDRQSPNVHVVAALSPRHSLHHPSSLASPPLSPSHPLAPSFYTLHLPVSPTSLLCCPSLCTALPAPSPPPPPPSPPPLQQHRCIHTYLTHSARETQTDEAPLSAPLRKPLHSFPCGRAESLGISRLLCFVTVSGYNYLLAPLSLSLSLSRARTKPL